MTLPRCQIEPRPGARKCEDCELGIRQVKHTCIGGRGRRGGIMVVGEKLGAADAAKGLAFVGREGAKLRYLLEASKLSIEQVYVTQAIKCPLPRGKKAKKVHLKSCRQHLLEEIRWVKPKVIVTMGTTSLQMIHPNTFGVKAERGFAREIKDKKGNHFCWLVPTVSVDHCYSQPEYDPIAIRDMSYAKEIWRNPEFQLPACEFSDVTVKTIPEFNKLCKRLYESSGWSFDLETSGFNFLKDDILCFSFCMDEEPNVGYVVPLHKAWGEGADQRWSAEQVEYIKKCMKRVFQSEASKTAQNGKFDEKFLLTAGIRVRNFDFDTMQAHHLVAGSAPQHDLTFIAQESGIIHTRYESEVDEQKRKHNTTCYAAFDAEPLFKYAAYDAIVCLAARRELEPELREFGVDRVFRKITMVQANVLMRMEFGGVRIDRPAMNDKLRRVNAELAEITKTIKEILNVPNFNPRSPAQLKEYFRRKRIRLVKETKSGGTSVDESVLKELAARKVGGDLPALVLRHRGLTKLQGTYLQSEDGKKGLIPQLCANNYLRSTFNIHGTYTGRISSSQPNLQNVPRENGIREMFIPDEPGDEFMGVDYQQLEVRVAAGLSKDMTLIEEVRQGVDLHSRNAAQFALRMDEEEFKRIRAFASDPESEHYLKACEFDRIRSNSKTITFAVLYGSSAWGISQREKIDIDECERFVKQFFRKYRGIHAWMRSQHRKVHETHRVVSPTGRFYHFPDMDWLLSGYALPQDVRRRLGDIERVAVNMPIQSFGSDIFQSQKCKLDRYLRENGMRSRLVLSLHDGFILNVKPEEKEQLSEVVPKIMNTVLNKGKRYEVQLNVDVEFTDRWKGK